jgi:hypothetical protein
MLHDCVTAVTPYFQMGTYDHPANSLSVTTFGVTMTFEWDAAKNRANIRKHGFDFAEAEEMFRGACWFGPIPIRTMARSDGLESG